MKSSYRIDFPEKGDKLQIHLQGMTKNDSGECEIGPLYILVAEIDLYEVLNKCNDNKDACILNTFLSVKKADPCRDFDPDDCPSGTWEKRDDGGNGGEVFVRKGKKTRFYRS